MRSFFAQQFAKARRWPRMYALGASGIFLILVTAPFHARAQGLVVQVNNISLSGQFSLRGLTADFPFPVMTAITVADLAGKPLAQLADTARWLRPQDIAENGRSITQNWTRLLEYHRDNPAFPPDPNLYNQSFGPLFTEVRASTPIPTSTMLVMDVSSSMTGELNDAKAGNLAFLDQLRPIDRAGAIQFCTSVTVLLPITSDKAPLRTAIAAATICRGTAIYDALMTAIQETKRESYRRAIILYTDGFDNSSTVTKQAVIDSAQLYNLPIFTIALGAGTDPVALQEIAANTGGLFFATAKVADFISIYKQLAVLIQNYYVMAHGSPDPVRNGTWRVVEATANTPTRSGSGKGQYFVPGRPAPRPTDLAVTMNSLTDLAVYENGQIINAVQPGEQYQYRLSVRNLGPERAETILLTHALPDSVRFLTATPSPYYNAANSVVWQIPRLNAGAADSITVTVQLAANVPATLQRLISSANIRADNDNSPGNNSAMDTVRVLFAPSSKTDVAVSQAALTDSFAVVGNDTARFARSGETYTYRLTVTNRSTITAKNITVTDFLPDSVRAQNFQPLPAIAGADSIRWLIAKLSPQSSMVLRFEATVSSLMPGGTNLLINQVSVRADNEDPARLMDNTSIDTVYNFVKPPPTDVAISLISHTDTTIVENGRVVNANKSGGQYDYQISVRNLGPARAAIIRLRQLLPDSVRFIAASQTPVAAPSDSLVWQIAQLNAGAADSIMVTVQLAPQVPPTLKLLISRVDLSAANDNSPGNNSATDTVRVVEPATPLQPTDLSVSMISHTDTTIVENGRVVNANKPGGQYDYQIKIRNVGPARAEGIRLRQLLPDSVRFIAASQTPVAAAGDSLVWQIAQLNAGAADSIMVTVQLASQVPPALKLLVSRVDLSAANDNSPGNNSATDTVRVVEPATPLQPTDVSVSMISHTDTTIVENGRIVNANKPGGQYDYQIKIRNVGPARAESIRLRQLLPDSVRFIAASQTPVAAAGDSLVWQIAQLNSGATDSITVTVQLAPQVPLTLKLLISRVDLSAANDNSPGNNSATDTVRVVESGATSQFADITVSQFARTDSFAVAGNDTLRYARSGETYRYTITAANVSAVTAQNIVVSDFLPDSVRATDFSTPPIHVTADSIQWMLPELLPQASVRLTFNATVAARMPVGTNLLVNKVTARATNDDPMRLADNTSSNTVYNIVKPVALTAPQIEALPPEVTVGSSVHVRVQVLVDIVAWDLWVYFADGQVDTTFADEYIKSNLLRPDGWHDVTPDFTNTRLFTAAKEEEIRFEIRTRDTSGNAANAVASVKVRSGNNMVLDRNVFRAEIEPTLGINFRLSSNRVALLELYDLNGLFVTKIAEKYFNADWNTYNWNGLMENGRKVGSGVYVIALRSGEFTAWKKCILVR